MKRLLTILLVFAFGAGPLTSKVWYRPGEIVKLSTPNACMITSEIDNTQTVQGSFIAGGFGGFSIRDNVTGASDVIVVADNPLDVAVLWQAGSTGKTGLPQSKQFAAQCRAAGCTGAELPFWGPDDCSQLVGSGTWLSGQARYPESDQGTLELIQSAHAQGLIVGLYINNAPCGPPGWQHFAVDHRDWCLSDPFGNIDGKVNLADLARWNDPTWTGANWMPIRCDWRNQELVNYALDRIVESVERYGWDFVRYDSQYTVAGDTASTIRNAATIRRRLTDVCGVGANFGKSGSPDAEAAILTSGGGLYLQETGGTWDDGERIRNIDANWYTASNGGPTDGKYVFPSHPMYFRGLTPAQCGWLQRWSGFLWDRRSVTIGGRLRSRRGSDGLRYDTAFFDNGFDPASIPGSNPTLVTTAPGATFGLAIWKIDDRLPVGTITVRCDRSYSGHNPPLGVDGRQWRPDLSTGTSPFLGFQGVGPFPAGDYKVGYRLWYEGSGPALVRLRVQDQTSGKDTLSWVRTPNGPHQPPEQTLAMRPGHQDAWMAFTLPAAGNIEADCWPEPGSTGALHLDSINFVKQ